MRLLIDIGNSRIKWALQQQGRLSSQQAMPHRGLTAQGLTTQEVIKEILQPCGAVEAVLISNVAGDSIAAVLKQAIAEQHGFEPSFVTSMAEYTVKGRVLRNAYLQPSQLGVDRWLGLVAARSLSADSVLVISAGTAITLDAVNPQGQHLGGLIIPGLNLMKQSLLQGTSDLAYRSTRVNTSQSTPEFLANNTLDGIQLGTIRAACTMIEMTHRQLQQLSDTKIILTGGAASELRQRLSVSSELIPDLVLQGLALCD